MRLSTILLIPFGLFVFVCTELSYSHASYAVPALIEVLTVPHLYRDWSIRRDAALALGNIGPDTKAHSPGSGGDVAMTGQQAIRESLRQSTERENSK